MEGHAGRNRFIQSPTAPNPRGLLSSPRLRNRAWLRPLALAVPLTAMPPCGFTVALAANPHDNRKNVAVSDDPNHPVAELDQDDVIPVMLRDGMPCHGQRNQVAGLDLTTRAGMLAGGKSGPAIVPGNPEKSLIVQKIVARQMPPKGYLAGGV